MTYTYKLARRLARLRKGAAFLLPILAACSAGEPTDISSDNPPIGADANGAVALSPRAVTLEADQRVLFRAFESLIPGSNQVTSIEWTATGGTIDAGGSYSPTATGAFKVVGRRKGNPHNQPDTAVVVVVPPQPTLVSIQVPPTTATVGGGLQQLFTVIGLLNDGTEVSVGVTWTATGGTIDAGGLFTAPRTAGTYKVIATHATPALADTALITVPPATLTSITMSPASVSLSPGQGQQFSVTGHLSDGTTTSSVPVAYAATGGSISVSGYYTAGSTGGTFRVIATAQGGKADTSAVTIASWTPPPADLLYDATLESGAWPTGTGLIQCAPGRIKIYTAATKPFANAPNPRSGLYSVKLETRDTDVDCGGTSSSRSQAESPRYMQQGGEYWLSESVAFPTDFPNPNSWFQFTELYSPVGGGVAAVAFYVVNSGGSIGFNAAYDATIQGSKQVATFAINKGQWHDFLLHIKVSTNPSVGFVELWHNGQNVALAGGVTTNGVSRLTCQTMLDLHASGGMGLFLNDYRHAATTSTGMTVVYFDQAKIGTSRTAVEQ